MNGIIQASVMVGALGCGSLAGAQDMRIRVVNGRNGKPITNECLNISLGKWHGAELLAPTNREGVVVLHIQNRQVTADATSPQACNGQAIVGPKSLTDDVGSISVMGDMYVACQEYGNRVSGQPPRLNTDLIPTYPITKILGWGVAATNTCGKFKEEAKPGELILFARPLSFWEKLRL
jgi:hypothetical protein